MVFFGGLVVKNLSANEGDSGSTPGWADPLEKEMATHSSILPENPMHTTVGWHTTVHGHTELDIT